MNAYWRACNYLSAGMLYLCHNPLLREPLKPEHIKNRLLGHWGSDPGQSFIWVHMNRLIKKYDLDMIYLSGPGHGAPATLSNCYLEGVYSEIYPDKSQDVEGLQKFLKQFSFPGGIGSHCTPETPGSIHEGGELGYSISHGFGAAFDNPDLIVTVAVGDGESETGPLATSWHSNKFLDPVRDGAVLPDSAFERIQDCQPDHPGPHTAGRAGHALQGAWDGRRMLWKAMTRRRCTPRWPRCWKAACSISARSRRRRATAPAGQTVERPKWPMIILRTPKGWTGPKEVDGHKVEGFWRAHQIPILDPQTNPKNLAQVEAWLRSYRPEELFDESGRLIEELREMAPVGTRRITANPHANGGLLRKPLEMPDFRDYAVKVTKPGQIEVSSTDVMAHFLRDVMRRNMTSFRVFGPDETASNKLQAIYEASGKTWMEEMLPEDAGRRLPGPGRPGDGDAERAHPRRMVRGLCADRAARLLFFLRGFRAHHRLHVQPACQVAGEEQAGDAVAGAHLLYQPADHLAGVAAGSQRLHPSGSWISGCGDQQEPGSDADLSSAGCELPAERGRPLPAQRQLRERDRRR